MADGKEPMQADGERDNVGEQLADERDPPSAGRPDMDENRGQSGGGAYPNPHNDPRNADVENSFMGHGGQSDMSGTADPDAAASENED